MSWMDVPKRLALFSVKYPKSVLLTGFLLALLSGYFASRLELKNDFVDLLPQKMPQVKLIKEVLSDMDGVGFQTIIATSPDKMKNRKFLQDLRKKLLFAFWNREEPALEQMQREYEKLGKLLRDVLSTEEKISDERKAELKITIQKFQQEKFVEYAYHENRQDFFEKRSMYYLSTKELETLHGRIQAKIQYELRKNMGTSIDDEEKDPGLNTSDIEAKYKKELTKIPPRLEAKDGKNYHSGLAVRPLGSSSDFTFAESFASLLKKSLQELNPKTYHAEMDVRLAGPFTQNLREYYAAKSELEKSFSITFVLLLVLLLFFFKRWKVLLYIMVPLLFSTAWSFALTYFVIGNLNVITGLIGALLLGLGVDYGIYLMDRYWQERRDGCNLEEAVFNCFESTGQALLTAGLTTSAGFFALLLCGFKGFSEFGFIAGSGIILCLLAVSTIFPALLVVFGKAEEVDFPKPLWTSNHVGKRSVKHPMIWVSISILILCSIPFLIRLVPIEFNMRKLTLQDDYFKVNERRWNKLQDKFIQSVNPIFYRASNRKEADSIQKQLETLSKNEQAFQKRLQRIYKNDTKRTYGTKAISNIYSIFRFVPLEQDKKWIWIQKIQELLRKNKIESYLEEEPEKLRLFKKYKNNAAAEPFGVKDLPYYIRRDMVLYDKDDFQKTNGYLVILYSAVNLFDARVALELKHYLDAVQIKGKKVVASGESIVFGILYQIIQKEGLIAIIASLLIVALVVLLDLRNLKLALLSLWPLLTGLLGMTVVLAVFQIPLNLFNFVVLPALLGICVDAGVHLLHHYRAHPERGTLGIQRELIGPISLAAFTTVISFATTITAKHLGMRSIGVLAIIGLLCGLVSSLYFLPALMELVLAKELEKDKEPKS